MVLYLFLLFLLLLFCVFSVVVVMVTFALVLLLGCRLVLALCSFVGSQLNVAVSPLL